MEGYHHSGSQLMCLMDIKSKVCVSLMTYLPPCSTNLASLISECCTALNEAQKSRCRIGGTPLAPLSATALASFQINCFAVKQSDTEFESVAVCLLSTT